MEEPRRKQKIIGLRLMSLRLYAMFVRRMTVVGTAEERHHEGFSLE